METGRTFTKKYNAQVVKMVADTGKSPGSKQELIYQTRFESRQEAKSLIFEYIEVFYNRKCLHSALDYVPPEEYEAARADHLLAA